MRCTTPPTQPSSLSEVLLMSDDQIKKKRDLRIGKDNHYGKAQRHKKYQRVIGFGGLSILESSPFLISPLQEKGRSLGPTLPQNVCGVI